MLSGNRLTQREKDLWKKSKLRAKADPNFDNEEVWYAALRYVDELITETEREIGKQVKDLADPMYKQQVAA